MSLHVDGYVNADLLSHSLSKVNPGATSIHPLSGCGSYIHGQRINHYTSLADLAMLFMSHYTPPRIENNWLVRSFIM